MDMRCDSVDIATFLGVYGMAATRVNRGNNGHRYKRNEIRLDLTEIQTRARLLALINRSTYVASRETKKQTRDDLRETSQRMGLVR